MKLAVPAQPGYFVLHYVAPEICDAAVPGSLKVPIIAWLIDRDPDEFGSQFASAVTFDDGQVHHILCPDGRVCAPCDTWWDSEAVWLDHMIRGHKEYLETQKKPPAEAGG